MNSLHAINRKARRFEENRIAETADVEALQEKSKKKQGRVYYPLGAGSFRLLFGLCVAGSSAGSRQQQPGLDVQMQRIGERLAQR